MPFQHAEVQPGDVIKFSYRVENRRFSDRHISIEVSLLENNQKIEELFSGGGVVNAFSTSPVYEWTLDTAEWEISEEYGSPTYTVNIIRNGVERKIRFHLARSIKYLPAPVPRYG